MFKSHDNILVLAGAGFSLDSGLPDYEGIHRLGAEAANQHGLELADIENTNFYQKNPRGAWGLQARIMDIFLTKKPHLGYHKLKEALENKNSFIITSNIDDHFREAGFKENNLYEIHGRLKVLQCINRSCNLKHNLWKLEKIPREENFNLIGKIPPCKYCGNIARPNVCFTDDNSFCNKLRNCQKKKFQEWIQKISKSRNPKLLILEIGCGRHKNAIGMQKLENGTFRILSRELEFPEVFNESNLKIIRVNPDTQIKKEKWEEVYYETGLKFFSNHVF
jgi:NAD-dependent SIR2 family protein deacetylase